MSLIRLPSASHTALPDAPSESEENVRINRTYWKSRRQVFATVILSLGSFSLGTVFGWGVGAIEDLKKGSKIVFNISVVASVFSIGALLSGPLAGYLMLKIGRKPTMALFGIITELGWVMIACVKALPNVAGGYVMYIGRFLTGFGSAACFSIAPVYVKEVTDDAHRAVLSSLVTLSAILGNVVGIILSVKLSWFLTTIICAVFPLIMLVVMIWIPESPSYLITKEKLEASEKSFKWLTAGYDPIESERMFKRLRRIVDFLNANVAMRMSARKRMMQRKNLKFTSKNVLRPAILGMLLIMFQQASGVNALLTYTISILEKGGSSMMSPTNSTILIAFLYLICVIIATFTVDKFGRKPFLFWGAIAMTLSHLLSGIYFFFIEKGTLSQKAEAVKNFSWVPTIAFTMYVISYAIGLGSVSWLVVTEINHPDFLEISGALTVTVYWIVAYLMVQLFPSGVDGMGFAPNFFIFAGLCLIASFFVYFGILETKGKTQDQIMEYFSGVQYDPDDALSGGASLGSIKNKNLRGRRSRRGTHLSEASDVLSEEDMVTLVEVGANDVGNS